MSTYCKYADIFEYKYGNSTTECFYPTQSLKWNKQTYTH